MSHSSFFVHGHFYQPPREDPLTGLIPRESGAAPYGNWNERIHSQCYYPNAMLQNFEKISFNIGPTLFTWMFDHDLETYQRIIRQERSVYDRYGVGNGMAQGYNHAVLPLASDEDLITQIRWGIADFEYRFAHAPLGLWLPETAVDLRTLEALAANNIQFTILAPWQVNLPAQAEIRKPYRVDLPSGKSVVVFLYNQDLSTRISFDPSATINADRFLHEQVARKFRFGQSEQPELIGCASDGELYGHHQPFRDKFLAHLMNGAGPKEIVRTFPALWLRENPVTERVALRENTSWSCHHGIQRWSNGCNCTPNAGWKAPFRQALDLLGRELNRVFTEFCGKLIDDPWELRNSYIQVLLGQTTVERLVTQLGADNLNDDTLGRLRRLLLAQYEGQRMFTSCGWFFEDYDRIEPRNNTAYAAQAVWLTRQATGVDLSEVVLDDLGEVVSWKTGVNARDVFLRHLQRARRSWA